MMVADACTKNARVVVGFFLCSKFRNNRGSFNFNAVVVAAATTA